MAEADDRVLVVSDPGFRQHVPPEGHPERPERLVAIERALEPLADRLLRLEPRAATDEEILRVHSEGHLTALRNVEGKIARLDPDTFTSERSVEIARLAAGSTVELARRVAAGESKTGLALIRPPGHHAEREAAMGFCLLNQIAIAAEALRHNDRLERIAIVDFDVHHGNGTQHAFEQSRDVLFLSLHQFPFYPGSGALTERGQLKGLGSTVNLPLPAGCGDANYGACFDRIVSPVLLEFNPDILLVSAGFDAHARDPLASMEVTSAGFARFAAQLRAVADEVCDGRLVLALEGGYDLDALGESVRGVVEALLPGTKWDFRHPRTDPQGDRLVSDLRESHAASWPALRGSRSV